MRRDYFSLEVSNADWLDGEGDPEKPRVTITFEGPAQTLRSRLKGIEGDVLEAGETDAAYRFHEDEEGEASGVFGLTNRVTGEFILEVNEDPDTVTQFIQAARRYGERVSDGDSRYEIRIQIDGEEVATYEKRTFLVYNQEGNLLRKESLIPSGVEL
jgi:hypothetical protein